MVKKACFGKVRPILATIAPGSTVVASLMKKHCRTGLPNTYGSYYRQTSIAIARNCDRTALLNAAPSYQTDQPFLTGIVARCANVICGKTSNPLQSKAYFRRRAGDAAIYSTGGVTLHRNRWWWFPSGNSSCALWCFWCKQLIVCTAIVAGCCWLMIGGWMNSD